MKVSYDSLSNSFVSSDCECLLPQIMWHITDRCYLNCKTCFVKERKMSGEIVTFRKMLDNLPLLKQLGVQKIDLSGGDPLLFRELPDLVERVCQEGFYITITTRGVGAESNRQWLFDNWMKFSRVIVSLDGGNVESCDFYSGYPGTYDYAVDTCRQLGKHGCDRLRINTVVNKCILDTRMKADLIRVVLSLQPKEWCIIEPHPSNRASTFEQYAVTGKEYDCFLESILSAFNNEQTKVLQRRKTMYGTYWALYPDNWICRLSEHSGTSFNVQLNRENMSMIVETLEQTNHLLP